MRLLYCGSGWLPVVELIRARLPAGATIECWDRSVPLAAAVEAVDVLLPSNAYATAKVIGAATRLRLIQQPAAGTEKIDHAAAAARGIPVCNAPGVNHVAVAELALLLLLSLARRVGTADARAAFAGREVGVPMGIELAGRTLGIVGLGRTGSALADRARALGMRVTALGRGASAHAKLAFFAAADAVSLHCPLSAETRHLVDAAALGMMKRGALLVNVARGGVIDRAALVEALPRLGGVGLDVHWDEPADPDDPLYADPKVIALPHVGGSTVEAFGRIADIVADNVRRLAHGEPLLHRLA